MSITKTPSKRNDKKRNIDKVTASLLKNPLQTEREVAKDVWIGNWTVHRAKEEMEQTGAKDDRVVNLTDWDFDLMKEIQVEKFRRLTHEKDKINNSDINKWDETASKRYTLFRWSATGKDWGLKESMKPDEIKKLSAVECDKYIKDIINS